MKSSVPVTFRVHFLDGKRVDVVAINAVTARDQARAIRHGIITKVKVLKEDAQP